MIIFRRILNRVAFTQILFSVYQQAKLGDFSMLYFFGFFNMCIIEEYSRFYQ